ncbi:hypothetical protein [Chitinophaga niabensis]|uniref:Uncharacterized protein n=1 Tax=Chitinophaga niabensis TaxID=536979 RepID=A0A1N6FJ75_9BACT|nr:hypothetical protein [Chitinophaga niabensis]SIN95260.1 hypothetical protein SAMN04488055_2247 [Chitinophaga niabensis]
MNNNWFEELPERCPPQDVLLPNGKTFYRLINGETPTSDDFLSTRAEFPLQVFSGVDECIVRSISIFTQKNDCENILKLARHKHKKVFEISLYENDGAIKQTFKASHHSWWRTLSFQISNENSNQ